MSEWDAIVKVKYSDKEDKIIEESETIGDDLEGMVQEWRAEAETFEKYGKDTAEMMANNYANQLETVLSGDE